MWMVIIPSTEGLNKTKRQRMGPFTIFVGTNTSIVSCPWSSVLLVFRVWDADQYSQTSVLEHLPSRTVRISTKMFLKKMFWVLNRTQPRNPFHDQSHISEEMNKGDNEQVCQFNTKPCAGNISGNYAVNIFKIAHRNWQLRSLVL